MTKKYIHLTIAKVFLSLIITSAFCLAQNTTSVSLVGETYESKTQFFDDEISKDVAQLDILEAKNTVLCPNDSVLLHSNFESKSYEWLKDGIVITGAVDDSLWVSTAGDYQLVCEKGEEETQYIKSEVISIKESTAPSVNISASSSELCPGDSIKLTGSTGGTCQWYLNGKEIPGANSNSYSAKMTGAYNVMQTNMSGCSDSSDVSFIIIEAWAEDCSLGPNFFKTKEISVYPNPEHTHLYINNLNVENASIKMTDTEGTVVLSESGITDTIYELEITQYKAGIYFIEINDKDWSFKIKAILN